MCVHPHHRHIWRKMNTLQWILTFFSWQGKQSVHPDHWLSWQSTGAGELTSLLLLLGRGRKSGLRSLKLCFERGWRLEGGKWSLCVRVFPPGSCFVGNGKHPKMSHPSIGLIRIYQGLQVQYLGILSWVSCSPKTSLPFPIGRLKLKKKKKYIYIWPTILSKQKECHKETGFKEKLIFCLSFQKYITISSSRNVYH